MIPHGKYELQILEQLFLSIMDKNTTQPAVNTERTEIISQEVNRIKQTLIHEVFSFEDERHLERYIQYHQQGLITLMDKSSNRLLLTEGTPPEHLNQHLYSGLEELLNFVERHFTKYFDQDAKAPEGYIAIARKDVRANSKKITKAFSTLQADPKLLDLVMHPLRRIVKDYPAKETTYRKVLYAKEMQKELFRLIQQEDPSKNIDEELLQIVYYLNYNSVKTFTYHAHYINEQVNATESRAEKIEKLSFLLKKINQAQVKPGIHYNLHASPLKDQLNEYIMVEIDYLERLQHLSGNPPGRSLDSFLQQFKLKIEISVAQLAYLIRIFTETKIIQNKNLTELLRFLARFVTTKRSETISYDSLRVKFYNVETGTKASVRNLLTSMIQYIDKD
jgi:hypothetical protein